jgi:formylglycine-generating enzyme required for sulfatase activity
MLHGCTRQTAQRIARPLVIQVMDRIAALLTLIALAGCASAPWVAVLHTVPPRFNIVPARRLAVIGHLGKPAAPEREGEFIDLVISKLQRYDQYDVKDERAFARSLDPYEQKDWHRYLDETAGEVIVMVGVWDGSCASWERTRDDGTEDADEVVDWAAECRASLALYRPHTGERIGSVNVDEYAYAATQQTAWNDAMSNAAYQIIGGFTPLAYPEEVDLDRDAPLVREGMARFDNRDYDGALSLWEDALKAFPDSAPLLYNLGALCEALKDPKAARIYYSRAIAIAPQEPRYRKTLAQLNQRRADADEAAVNPVVEDARKSAEAKERAARMAEDEESIAGMQYVLIPAGQFTMGCTKYDIDCEEDESPPHSVTIDQPFYFARTPVTNAEYQQCIDAGVCHGSADPAKPIDPVVRVTWINATEYCSWIGGRLPTEAEWEYAARGGVEGWRFPWGNSAGKGNANLAEPAEGHNVEATGVEQTNAMVEYPFVGRSPVGTFAPNGFALYDMTGNVSEWTADWSGPYANAAVADPTGPATGTVRVVRGGSWAVTGKGARLSIRYVGTPDRSANTIGFRCAVDSLRGER